MSAGYNVWLNIWRITFPSDNVVGGSQPSGTVVYSHVPARFQANPEEQLLLQQGLETQRTFKATLGPGTLDIYERDEVEVTHPFDHHYFGDRFRIISVSYSDHNPRDPRNYLMLTLRRIVRAQSNAHQ